MNVCRGAGVWSRTGIIINITKGSFFVSPKEEADSEDLWQCGSCGKEFDSYEVARFHEDNKCEDEGIKR